MLVKKCNTGIGLVVVNPVLVDVKKCVMVKFMDHCCLQIKELQTEQECSYTLFYRHVCVLVFLHVFAYSMLLRCTLKFKRLACGSDDVTQYNTILLRMQRTWQLLVCHQSSDHP